MPSSSWQTRRRLLDDLLVKYQQDTGTRHSSVHLLADLVASLILGQPDLPFALEFTKININLGNDFVKLRDLVKSPQSAVTLVKCTVTKQPFLAVRKSVSKMWASRMRGQMSPFHERSMLLRAMQQEREDVPLLLGCLQDQFELYTLLEYCPLGTVWQVLESSPSNTIEEGLLKIWMAQSVVALDWVHQAGWVHRDVKPHNLLLDHRGNIKLTDFGSAAPIAVNGKIPSIYTAVVVGTIDYIAPEVLLAHQQALEAMEDSTTNNAAMEVHVTPAADWWSIGVVLYECLFGQAPFFAEAVVDTYDNILNHAHTLAIPNAVSISSSARDLICSLLTTSEERLTCDKVKKHSFFAGIGWTRLRADDLSLKYPLIKEQQSIMLSPSQSTASVKAFDFSALFSSPGLSILKATEDDAEYSPAANDWTGFSFVPPADIFERSVLKATPSVTANGNGFHLDIPFQTPARANISSHRQLTASTRKKRQITDLEAFREVADYGLRSVQKRRASVTPAPAADDIWSRLQQRQQTLIQNINVLEERMRHVMTLD